MEEEKKEVPEVAETALEIMPSESGIVKGGELKEDVEGLLFLAENIDKVIAAKNKIRMALLKLAKPGDWSIFKSKEDPVGKAELGHAGAFRISSTVGINFSDWQAKKEQGSDEKGSWYRWEVICSCIQGNRRVKTYGRAGTRDKFFGKEYGKFKDLSDVNEGDLRIAAIRGAMKEGVKVLMGLHHMDPKELEKLGVPMKDVGGHTYDSGKTSKGGVITDKQRTRLWAIAKEAGCEEPILKQYLRENHKYTEGHLSYIKMSDYESICDWASGKPKEGKK